MLIGFDASRAFVKERTGTENYTYQLLRAIAKMKCQHRFRLYTRTNAKFEYLPAKTRGFRCWQAGQNPKQIHPSFAKTTEGAPRNLGEVGQSTKDQNSKHLEYLNLEDSNLFRASSLEFSVFDNFELKIINWPFLWTQAGLALESWLHTPDLLFIPAHVIPFLKNPRVPTVVVVHDLAVEFLPHYQSFIQKTYLSKLVEGLRAKLATHIIAVSESTKEDLVRKLEVPEEKISVVYEGIDEKKFKVQSSKFKVDRIKRKYGIEGNYILFVGTIQPRKNLVRLIESFAKVRKNLDIINPNKSEFRKREDLLLVIVGKGGWLAEEIYQAPVQFGILDEVKFLDYVPDEDLPFLYSGALCFCLPSLHEGFGLPVLEAMASGCPVVISGVSSLPEVGGNAAVYVDPYNVDDITRNLELIINNEELRKKLINRGFQQVKKFSWEKCAKETIDVFEKVA